MTVLHIDLKVGESLQIGTATVTLEKKSGQLARLVVNASQDMPIRKKPAHRASDHFSTNDRSTK